MTLKPASDLCTADRPAPDAEASARVVSFLILCINYDSDEETLRFLDCLRGMQMQSSLSVIVVDNTPRTRRESLSLPDQGGTVVLRPPENLGYLGGARYGLAHYLQDRELPDWILISNVDLVIKDTDFFARLSELALPGVAAVAPAIRSLLSGHDQNPYLRSRPSSLRMHAYKWVYRSRLLLNLTGALAAFLRKLATGFNRGAVAPPSKPGDETIYAPHGSFLILSKEYFRRGGDLAFPGFLFGEEIYIAETIRRLGLSVIYRPELEVFHQEHRSTRLFKSRKLAADVAFSAAYCADTFFPLRVRNGKTVSSAESPGRQT